MTSQYSNKPRRTRELLFTARSAKVQGNQKYYNAGLPKNNVKATRHANQRTKEEGSQSKLQTNIIKNHTQTNRNEPGNHS